MRRLAATAVVVAGMLVVVGRPVAAQAVPQDPGVMAPAAQSVAPAPAEQPPATVASPSSEGNGVARFGPSVESAKLLLPAQTPADDRKLGHVPAYRRSAPGVALMIVGGALFLAGAIIDSRAGDAVMVGGVVVAAIGLYQYLQ